MSQSQEFLKRLNAALALRDIPDYPAAMEQLHKAQALDPEDASVHLLLGLTNQELGQLEDAEKSLRRAYELDPNSLEIRESYGILLSRIQKNQDAIQLLQPLFKSNPKNATISKALAASLRREGKVDEAIEVLQTTQLQSNDADIVLDLVDLYQSKRQDDQAEKLLLDFLNIELSPKVLSRLGRIYLIQKKYEKAIQYYKKAISIKEDSESAWIGLTRSHLEQGNLGFALEVVNSGIIKKPKSKRLFQLKGEILFSQEKKDEALQAYDCAIELSRLSGKPFDLGYLLYLRDRKVLSHFGTVKALDYIEEDIRETEGFPLLISLKTNILIDQKKYRKAIKFIEGLDPKRYEDTLLPNYYQALIGIGDYDKAFDLLQRTIQSPSFEDKDILIDILESDGVDLFSNNEVEKSKKIFEHILMLEPIRSQSLNNLAFIHISQHQWDDALDHLEKAQINGYPDMGILLTNRGYVYLCKGEYETGIQILQKALSFQKEEDKGDEDDKEEALLHIVYPFDKLLSFSEEDDYPERSISIRLAIYANLATAYYLNGKVNQALKYANDAIDQNPGDNIGYRLLGNLYYSEGQLEKAAKSWRKALRSEKSRKEAKRIKESLTLLADRETKYQHNNLN